MFGLIIAVLAAADPAAGESTAAAPLRLSLTPGRVAVYRFVTEQKVRTKAGEETRSMAGYTLRQKILSVAGPKAATQVVLERIEWSTTNKEGSLSFDSSKPIEKRETPELTALRSAVGRTFMVGVDDRGRISEIRSPRLPSGPKRDLEGDLVGEHRLRSLLIAQYAWLPEEPVQQGSQWVRNEEAPLGVLTLARKNDAILTRKDDDSVDVQVRIDVSHRPADGVDAQEGKVTARIVSASPGAASIRFSTAHGLLESLTAEVSFDLIVEAAPKSRFKRKPVVSQSLEAATRIELLSLDGRPVHSPQALGN